MSSERWSTTAIRALGRVKLTAPESARRARCTPMPLGSRSTPISGAAAESSAISTLARAETAGLTLRCAENGGWHAPLRFDLRRPRVVAKRNPCLLLALIPDQLSNDTRAPVLKSPFHGHRGECLWKSRLLLYRVGLRSTTSRACTHAARASRPAHSPKVARTGMVLRSTKSTIALSGTRKRL